MSSGHEITGASRCGPTIAVSTPLIGGAHLSISVPEDDGTPAGAVDRLRAGNRRVVDGEPRTANRDRTHCGPAPFAAVLGCSDLPVTEEAVFDLGLGDLFVVRLAGGIAAADGVASLEFAGALLEVRAIVILGHTRCEAVEAALAGRPVEGQVSALFQRIAPGVDRAHPDLDRAVEDNALAQRRNLLGDSPVLADRVARGKLVVESAVYDLITGAVRILT